MRGRLAKVLLFVVSGALALAAGYFVHRIGQPEARMPDAAGSEKLLTTPLPDLEGRQARIADWRGKVLVVNFWATWCAPCREEIPALVRTQVKFGQQGLQIIGVALDDLDRVRPFARDMGINYPTLLAGIDGLALASAAGNKVGALPFTVYIDRQGKVIRAELGGVDDAKLAALITPLL